MLVRALVVLLLVLNLGVAAWWALRAPPAPPSVIDVPFGVARLQRVGEGTPAKDAPPPSITTEAPTPSAPATPPPTAPAPASPTTASPATATAPVASARCYSVGPFADSAAAQRAHELLLAVSTRIVPREQRTGSARGWRVYLPAAATAEEAQATAQRIAAAGFNDYFIVRQGNEANSIALGRYRSEDSARRRAETLNAAGFPARAEPLGDGRTNVWLDLVAGANFDPARAEAAVLVPARPLDCARIR